MRALFLFLLFPFFVLADSHDHWICTHKKNSYIRKVRVENVGKGCRVLYMKPTEKVKKTTQTIYTSKISHEKCHPMAGKFLKETLIKKLGWRCQLLREVD